MRNTTLDAIARVFEVQAGFSKSDAKKAAKTFASDLFWYRLAAACENAK
jgi:hypothetical protein